MVSWDADFEDKAKTAATKTPFRAPDAANDMPETTTEDAAEEKYVAETEAAGNETSSLVPIDTDAETEVAGTRTAKSINGEASLAPVDTDASTLVAGNGMGNYDYHSLATSQGDTTKGDSSVLTEGDLLQVGMAVATCGVVTNCQQLFGQGQNAPDDASFTTWTTYETMKRHDSMLTWDTFSRRSRASKSTRHVNKPLVTIGKYGCYALE
jgi:hypothetical protein